MSMRMAWVLGACVLWAAACGGEGAGAAAGQGGAGGAGGNGQAGASAGASGAGGVGGAAGASGASGAGSGGASGAGGTGGTGGSDAIGNETEACIAYVRAFCDARVRCSFAAPTSAAEREDSVRVCMSDTAYLCPDVMFSEGSQRTLQGTLACIDAWDALSCEDYAALRFPACALPGTKAAGETCAFPMQCASRACSLERVEGCGTCTSIAQQGESCDSRGVNCADGLRCAATCELPEEPPSPGTVTVPTIGEPCTPGGVPCVEGSMGAWCMTDAVSGTSTCQSLPTLGQDCSASSRCKLDDSYCDATTRVCSAYPAAGQPCASDVLRGSSVCGDGMWCEPGAFSCDPQLGSCMVGTASCQALPAGGESCTTQQACAGGLTCACDGADCATKTCVHERLPGESCTGAFERCLAGASTCQAGVCVAAGSQGLFALRCGP